MSPRQYATWPYLRCSTALRRAFQHASPTLGSVSLAYYERALGAPAGTATMAASVSARGGAHRGCACRVDDSLSSIGAPLSRGGGGLARRCVSRAGGGRADVEGADDHCSPLRVSGAQDAQPLSLIIPRRRAGGRLG